jgi:hypothetical protein
MSRPSAVTRRSLKPSDGVSRGEEDIRIFVHTRCRSGNDLVETGGEDGF